MVKKLISELLGTFLLVFFGCGAAVIFPQFALSVVQVDYLLVALTFGLVLMAIVYMFGKVSGAHVNPAVSIAMLIDGRMDVLTFVGYVVAQIIGGIAGAAALYGVLGELTQLGANGFGTIQILDATGSALVNTIEVKWLLALIIEAILTFVFVLVVLSVTKKENSNNGIVIGLTLALVHIFGLPFTGTSVNPARSIGPALFTGGTALSNVWVFIVGPLVGGILAALLYRFVLKEKEAKTPVKAVAEIAEVEVEAEEKPVAKKVVAKKAAAKKSTKKSK
jgi:aquaporin Z